MSIKVKKLSKIVLTIITLPIICNLIYYATSFILQLGRIVGSIIRVIMSL